MLVGNNLVQFGCFAIVDFLRQGEHPLCPAPAGMWLCINFYLADQISVLADFELLVVIFFFPPEGLFAREH